MSQPTTCLYLAAYAGLVVGAKALLDTGVHPYARLDSNLPDQSAYNAALRQRGTDIEDLFRSYRRDDVKSAPTDSKSVGKPRPELRVRFPWIPSLKAWTPKRK
jgi:hypothetical protein